MHSSSSLHHASILFAALLSIVCWLSAVAQAQNAANADRSRWFERAIVGMEVGPTGAQFGHSDPTDVRYCSKWNGQGIVQKCVEANAEYLVLWLRDGDFAYYNSKLVPKAPGLLDRDPLREALDEAAKHNLPVISYCVVQQGGIYLQDHPQWKMRDAEGNQIDRFCYHSGYLEAMKQLVAEQLAYGIDGFHIDMLDQGFGKPYGCWCDTCREKFRAEYGHSMPTGVTWDKAWDEMLEFRYASSERFEQELTRYIRSLNPNATVDYNYHGNPPFSFEVGQRPVQHAGNGDFVTGETGVWGFSALGVGLNAEFYRAATPGVPFQVAIQRGVRMYHDQTTRPLHDMRWETLTLLAHGAFVTLIDKTAFDGSLDPMAYERMGQVLAEARAKRAHFGQNPVFDIGLYFSSRTRDWVGREEAAKYFQCFQGAHQACVMEHLQFGVILDENATLDTLRQFPAVCLPNVAIISEREAELFHNYVREGGKLLITGHPGQFDERGKPQQNSVLADLIGASVVERLESEDNWISVGGESSDDLQEKAIADELQSDWPFLVKGSATVYRPTTATGMGKLYKPHRTQRQRQGKMGTEWPMSADVSVGPAVLVNAFGKGMVVTCAGSPDFATASEHALVEDRVLFRNLFRALQTKRRVVVDAPANVEAVITDDMNSRTLRIHLLAYNATPRTTPQTNRPYVLPGMIEDEPIYRV
ncbi:MAG: hypothetical protein KDA87_14995, partial [Planctomycetales bacterium]|nr:hypothetical protein [Planctomycetales bacterium]